MADGKDESSLNKNVPRFNGMNFAKWRPSMHAYLQMIGALCLTNGTAAFPADAADQATWRLLDDRAYGSMSLSLRIHFNHLILEEQTNPGPPVAVMAGARCTLDTLNAHFRAIGAAGVFSNFSTAVKFKIHEREDVPAKLRELDGLFSCITALNLAENLHAMIMLSELPDPWDQLASTLLGTIALADLTPANIIPRIHKESAHHKEHGSSSHHLSIIQHNTTSCDICHKGHSMQNHWYKHSENQPFGSGSQNQQAGPSNHPQGTHSNTRGKGCGHRGNNCGCGQGGKGKGRANAVDTGIANALNVNDKYAKEDFFAHIEDYDDDTASNQADITFPFLNPPAKEARNFFLKGICNSTIHPNGF
ncbi:hypothetical protein PAXRUDRAFT_141352 [Paxillus rubicundulus Ve08.2h10]|uniref:Uncharacterized protein n=1 Tax=Paxillus rubicundulus Ve08.2h10 TaxID=930991 RepID=A0A0D0DD03_9AGAM|nr:hypothetical protein PAXRUDRAFT_141352 [Paxillus rubicundulus Ve08.2h10]